LPRTNDAFRQCQVPFNGTIRPNEQNMYRNVSKMILGLEGVLDRLKQTVEKL